jgi:catechol 2,3-dioxygenase-like lactoylglutathione lyase family enzyme
MDPISTTSIHHVALTVSDVRRSQAFYTDLLGFKFVADFGPRVLLHNGSFVLALTPPSDPSQAIAGDRFNENRIGLDHISLSVGGMEAMEAAARALDAAGVTRGEIRPLEGLGIAVMAVRDPDNIQLELTATV